MLTKLVIRNFKRFGASEVEIQLGGSVVFIGPNNSGKTTAMQALTLWHEGVLRWREKRNGSGVGRSSRGVTLSRRDLVFAPAPRADLLWHRRRTRNARRVAGKWKTGNIRIDVLVEGFDAGGPWACGLEFDYANEETLYCRPLRTDPEGRRRMPVPEQAVAARVAFLSPMSGLTSAEPRLDQGAVNVRVGEGRTAEILRNLCYRLAQEDGAGWGLLAERIEALFGIRIEAPKYVPHRGEITMDYEEDGIRFDLSCSGRGLQQTLLLMAHLHANPGAVLLLEEPDSHLEILRQRDTYRLLSETAAEQGGQVIAASHSEAVLREAAERNDPVIAFGGPPCRMPSGALSRTGGVQGDFGFDRLCRAE